MEIPSSKFHLSNYFCYSSLFIINLTSSSSATFFNIKPIVNSIFLKNFRFKVLQLGRSKKESSWAILLGPIPDAVVPSTSFKLSSYQLEVFLCWLLPFKLFPLNLDGAANATDFSAHLEHETSTVVAIPRPVLFIIIVPFFHKLAFFSLLLLTF